MQKVTLPRPPLWKRRWRFAMHRWYFRVESHHFTRLRRPGSDLPAEVRRADDRSRTGLVDLAKRPRATRHPQNVAVLILIFVSITNILLSTGQRGAVSHRARWHRGRGPKRKKATWFPGSPSSSSVFEKYRQLTRAPLLMRLPPRIERTTHQPAQRTSRFAAAADVCSVVIIRISIYVSISTLQLDSGCFSEVSDSIRTSGA